MRATREADPGRTRAAALSSGVAMSRRDTRAGERINIADV